MAITTNKGRQTRGEMAFAEFPVAAGVNILQGSNVAVNATGYAVTGSDLSTIQGVGVAVEQANNTDGSAGDIYVKVYNEGEIALPVFNSGSLSASFNRVVAIRDNEYVEFSASNVNGVRQGFIVQSHDTLSGYAWIRLDVRQKTNPLGSTE